VNPWALYDEAEAGYANYAVRTGEYPSLYRLSVPARQFEPYLADGMPSAVPAQGGFYTTSVTLRSGLYWSDGSPLTADDVAFTVNTALAFHLRLDWSAAYDPEVLDHAAASGSSLVQFFFKKPLTVEHWQYGALQGPVLSKAYWSSRLDGARALLPPQDLQDSLQKTLSQVADIQARIDEDNAILLGGVSDPQRLEQLRARIQNNQDELNSLNTKTVKLQDELNAALDAARQALFALPADGEPVFGPYLRYAGSGETLTRSLNPSYPFARPAFDGLVYSLFPDERSAVTAFDRGAVDVVLSGKDLSPSQPDRLAPTNSVTFLVFNPLRPELADPVLHRALACILTDSSLDRGAGARPFSAFVLPGPWSDAQASLPCSGLSSADRLPTAVGWLADAGYTWLQVPSRTSAGSGIRLPGGQPLQQLSLLSVASEDSPLKALAAEGVARAASTLGIPVRLQALDAQSLRYAVLSSGDYDLAVLGWRLAEYPAYLCQWFGSPGSFYTHSDVLHSACGSIAATADLPAAQQGFSALQSWLASELPFIPLYQALQHEAVRNVSYPFDPADIGVAPLYGAPELASPPP
jgi:ABC-type transport system substrate-binding protein